MTRDEIIALDDRGMTAWDAHDTATFTSLFADDFEYVDDGLPTPMRSVDEVRNYMEAWYRAFPDMRARELNRVVDEDSAWRDQWDELDQLDEAVAMLDPIRSALTSA